MRYAKTFLALLFNIFFLAQLGILNASCEETSPTKLSNGYLRFYAPPANTAYLMQCGFPVNNTLVDFSSLENNYSSWMAIFSISASDNSFSRTYFIGYNQTDNSLVNYSDRLYIQYPTNKNFFTSLTIYAECGECGATAMKRHSWLVQKSFPANTNLNAAANIGYLQYNGQLSTNCY